MNHAKVFSETGKGPRVKEIHELRNEPFSGVKENICATRICPVTRKRLGIEDASTISGPSFDGLHTQGRSRDRNVKWDSKSVPNNPGSALSFSCRTHDSRLN